MKKIIYVIGLCCMLMLLALGCHKYSSPLNYRVESISMCKVDGVFEGDTDSYYLLGIELKHCTYRFTIGGMPYPRGILDPIKQIKVFDMRNKDITSSFMGLATYRKDSVKTWWMNYGTKKIPCYYCANIEQLQDKLNWMSVDIRSEYYCKEKDAHYAYRLFRFPSKKALPNKLVFQLNKERLEVRVCNQPIKLKLDRVVYPDSLYD